MKHTTLSVLIAIGLTIFMGLTRWQNLSEDPLIQTDGQGYHAYLPAVFIYHDLQFSFVDSVVPNYYPEGKRANFVVASEAGNVNKYFVGTAIVQAPFFLVGCAISWISGVPVDGYSWPFQFMSGIAAIVSLCLGVWFLGKLLLGLGFNRLVTNTTLVFIAFGTNLLYYTLYEPSMSHVYSFFTVSAFLFYGWKALTLQHGKSLMLAAAALALTVLVRPVNALVILGIPAITSGLFGLLSSFEAFLKEKKSLLAAVVISLVIVLIQPLIYFLQTGAPFVWSYQEEGFNFLSPELYNVLFSYRKGLFVYCPILLLAVLGMFSGLMKEKARYAWLVVALSVASWVIASWWMWYYGGCYGHRAFIEYYPLFAIGLAYLLQRGWWVFGPRLFALLGVALIGVQLVQTYQYKVNIIPFDNMTKTRYWNLFLRTGVDLQWYYLADAGQDEYVGIDSLLISYNLESEEGLGNEGQRTNEVAYQGEYGAVMNSEEMYGLTVRKQVSELSASPNVVRVSAMVNANSSTTDLSFVCALEDSSGASYFWKSRPLRVQFDGRNEWSQVTAVFKCGFPRDSTDRFTIYPMKSDGAIIYFDDLEVSFVQAR